MTDSGEIEEEGLSAGTVLYGDSYKIIEKLGQGGFGITYLAQQFTPERLVAIKEFFPGGSARRVDRAVTATGGVSRDEFDRLRRIYEREGNALAKFDHPNIVSIFDVFEENDTAYLVLAYLDGTPLEDMPRCETEDAVRAWLMPVLDALEAIHNEGLLHRDISPDNIMVVNGKPVLLDFGAVRLGVDADEKDQKQIKSRKKSSFAMVKDGYAPPEQYTAGSRQSEATDIYALAATVYFTITGKDPVSAQARQNELIEGDDDPLEPLSKGARKGYSESFFTAIDTALSVRKKDRPKNVSEWRKLIEKGKAVGVGQQEAAPVAVDSEQEEIVYETVTPEPKPEVNKAAILTGLVVAGGLIAAVVIGNQEDSGEYEDAAALDAEEAMCAAEGATDVDDWATNYSDKFLSGEEDFYVTGEARERNLPTSEGTQVTQTYSKGTLLRGRWVEGKDTTTKWLKTDSGSYIWEGNIGGTGTIHPTGMDGLFAGDTLQAMQVRLSPTGRYGSQMSDWDSSCEIYESKNGKFDVMFENNVATSFSTSDRSFSTQKGIKVGMNRQKLYQAYGDSLKREPNPYSGENIIYWLRKEEGINFHIDDSGLISTIKSGTNSINYVEGCL